MDIFDNITNVTNIESVGMVQTFLCSNISHAKEIYLKQSILYQSKKKVCQKFLPQKSEFLTLYFFSFCD